MALMKCQECGNEVSTKAQNCQKCGAPAPILGKIDRAQMGDEKKYTTFAVDQRKNANRLAEKKRKMQEEGARIAGLSSPNTKKQLRRYALHWLWISPVFLVIGIIANVPHFWGVMLVFSWLVSLVVVLIPKLIWVIVPILVFLGYTVFNVPLLLIEAMEMPTVAVNKSVKSPVASSGKLADIKRLLATGANPNAGNKYGGTALIGAAFDGNAEVVKVLLSSGANPNTANDDGKTALYYAQKEGHYEIARLLEEAGAQKTEFVRKAKQKKAPTTVAKKPAKKPRVVETSKKISKMSFNQCLFTMDGMLANLGVGNADIIVDTNIMKWVKIPTSDGSVSIVCSKPDEHMVITRFGYN